MAGQRIDPSKDTKFIWRVKSADGNSETVSLMKYQPWKSGEPNGGSGEPCVQVATSNSQWNDFGCNNVLCSICEIES